MAITAAEVNKLRQITGSGIMDCKSALLEAEGDIEKAIDVLRKKGQKVAAKRADRNASEGYVIAKTNPEHTYGVVLMLNCETDFVGKTSDFIECAESIIDFAIANKVGNLQQLFDSKLASNRTVQELLVDITGKTGEKIELNQFETLEKPFVAIYNHNGNRLATLVGFNKKAPNLDVAGHEVAMQIAAMNPISVNEKDVPQNVIDRELDIAREQIRNEGKPEAMVDKIAQGKLNKFFKENTLVNQDFIRDSKKTVGQYLKEVDTGLIIETFYRLQLGE
ncbi:MAG: translation elongation factor Ts [Bacteroidales bacterium]|jgi:elongation factor Ts|nr:translation elongation factor Ts [Bacteroidales bacterium]